MLKKIYNLLSEGQATQERLDDQKREYESDHNFDTHII